MAPEVTPHHRLPRRDPKAGNSSGGPQVTSWDSGLPLEVSWGGQSGGHISGGARAWRRPRLCVWIVCGLIQVRGTDELQMEPARSKPHAQNCFSTKCTKFALFFYIKSEVLIILFSIF